MEDEPDKDLWEKDKGNLITPISLFVFSVVYEFHTV